MRPAPALKLVALDSEDLAVISAHVQDSVLKVRDFVWEPSHHRFALAMNRFAWEVAIKGKRPSGALERRRAALHFDRVLSVRTIGINRDAPDGVLSLLAAEFIPSEEPAGEVRLVFAGGGEISLSVECIEAQLADLGAAWQTKAMPAHDIEGKTVAASGRLPK